MIFKRKSLEKEAKEKIVDSLIGVAYAKNELAHALGIKMKKSLDISLLQEAMSAAILVAKGAHMRGDDVCAKEMISFVEENLSYLRLLTDVYSGLDEAAESAAEAFNKTQKEAEDLIRMTETSLAKMRFAKSFDAATRRAVAADAALSRLEA